MIHRNDINDVSFKIRPAVLPNKLKESGGPTRTQVRKYILVSFPDLIGSNRPVKSR